MEVLDTFTVPNAPTPETVPRIVFEEVPGVEKVVVTSPELFVVPLRVESVPEPLSKEKVTV